ncbi:secondary thiamine-phosphate synthase enzyme YjbQ [Desulforhopalus sp. IMCC35007]|uniref:secondary thiamine-phosphate synthase enzyme YjbQ n=1 Tax=Desulforhopalus sp. IMCC35007 TaxID=2569543 RepID=UPI0010ADFDA3|nr:secondary thiamine-phosphate synthase enzyme YjbQ [Desulforhopalus sp. IMCC35007]TKB12184.1 YjbQ family protein [Desulforhopalus sp. IMCC35007]
MNKGSLKIKTSSQRELQDITTQIAAVLSQCSTVSGVLYLFNPHTTAGLTINEGADHDVQKDIITALSHIVPQLRYRHAEGNSPAHIMTLMTGSSLMVQVEGRELVLGTWQRIFFCEYDGPRTRSLHWKYIPDTAC